MNKKVEKEFLDLVKENPELPIVYFVDQEAVGDEYATYGVDIVSAYKGESAYYDDRWFDDREEFKEIYYDKNDEKLTEKFGYHPFRNHWFSITDEELEKYLDEIANRYFHESIIVNFGYIDDRDFTNSPFYVGKGDE